MAIHLDTNIIPLLIHSLYVLSRLGQDANNLKIASVFLNLSPPPPIFNLSEFERVTKFSVQLFC